MIDTRRSMICFQMSTPNFSEWLLFELEQRGWTQADLARKSGLTTSAISRMLGGNRGIGPEACNAIAAAFDYSPEFVFRQAGLLPWEEASETPPGLYELNEIFKNATPEEQAEMLEYVRWRAQKAQENKGRARKRGLKPREA